MSQLLWKSMFMHYQCKTQLAHYDAAIALSGLLGSYAINYDALDSLVVFFQLVLLLLSVV